MMQVMDPLQIVEQDQIDVKDGSLLVWLKVTDVATLLWQDNPKMHDLGGLIQSIARHGFRDKPVLDANLKSLSGTQGAIISGNGRIEALARMEQAGDYDPPRGIGIHKDGGWTVQVIVGTDARSAAEAEALALDVNNLVLLGGDLTGIDLVRLYDGSYKDLLRSLAEQDALPVSVDGTDMDLIMSEIEDFAAPSETQPEDDAPVVSRVCPECGFEW